MTAPLRSTDGREAATAAIRAFMDDPPDCPGLRPGFI